jgi:hypothetical protein
MVHSVSNTDDSIPELDLELIIKFKVAVVWGRKRRCEKSCELAS